jgi:hypothetical protein
VADKLYECWASIALSSIAHLDHQAFNNNQELVSTTSRTTTEGGCSFLSRGVGSAGGMTAVVDGKTAAMAAAASVVEHLAGSLFGAFVYGRLAILRAEALRGEEDIDGEIEG